MRWPLALTAIALLLGGMTASGETSGDWVAQPRRALDIEWPPPVFAGRDFWTLLDPEWLELPGLKDEEFVRGSGLMNVRLPRVKEHVLPQRVLVFREIAVYQGGAPENTASEATLAFIPEEAETVVLQAEHASDGRSDTSAFVSADICDSTIVPLSYLESSSPAPDVIGARIFRTMPAPFRVADKSLAIDAPASLNA
mgnify:CR=1 FL=1